MDNHSSKVFAGKSEFAGHSYVIFRTMNESDLSMIHDPDCICWILNDSI